MSKSWIIIVIILVVAGFFRLYQLDQAPPGLYPDEAINGNNAVAALDTGEYKVFYPENNGREGLFINLVAGSIAAFGQKPWTIRLVSAIAGILTVWGLYLLTKELFNRQIGWLSAALLAMSFWHVNFSRVGFRAVLAPMLLVFALYFLWRGLRSKHLMPFALSGVFWGLGFYTYISFRIIPLAAIAALLAYWHFLKKDYDRFEYEHAKVDIARGLSLLLLVVIAVAMPLGIYYYQNPADFLGRTGQLSIFSSDSPLKTALTNTVQTLGMFNFEGDYNWRHNFSGSPMLWWPVGVLFVIGLIRSVIKCLRLKKEHGHFSSIQTLLLSWFIIGLFPVVLSNEGMPHALRAIIVIPVAYIFAGEGLWWLYQAIKKDYRSKDVHEIKFRRLKISEAGFVSALTIILILSAVGIYNFDKYFNKWAKNPSTAASFNQNYVELGEKINRLPEEQKKYVLVNASGVLVNVLDPADPLGQTRGLPMPAQTVMFVTDTATPDKQKAKNVFYLTEDEFVRTRIEREAIVLPMEAQ